MSGFKGRSRDHILQDIGEIADAIPKMRELPDGKGNSLISTQSLFDKAHKQIQAYREEGQDERYNRAVLEALSNMLIDLIPIAEHYYRKHPGDRFAATSLTNYTVQLRDVRADIRRLQTFEAQAERLQRVNSLQLQRIFQNFTDEIYKIRKATKSGMTGEQIDGLMMKSIESHGIYIKESLKLINDSVDEQLVRDAK